MRVTNWGNYIIIFNELLDENLAKIAPSFIFIAMGLYGMIYPIVAYLVNSNWKILMVFQGVPTIYLAYRILILNLDDEIRMNELVAFLLRSSI